MQFSYQTTLKDFRVATLYGTFMRNAGLFRIMRWLLPSGAVYLIGSYYELWPFNSIALFLLGGYIVWLLILLGLFQRKPLQAGMRGQVAHGVPDLYFCGADAYRSPT